MFANKELCVKKKRIIDILNIFEYNKKHKYSKRNQMKTVTMRVDDTVYQMIKTAADGQRRNISNFIEYATLQYLTSSQYVSDAEMDEILKDQALAKNLELGLKEAKDGDYTIV